MSLYTQVLQTIIKEEEPISTYKISKLLNKPFNSVKYNIKKLENIEAILESKTVGKQYNKAIYYIPNKMFIEVMDTLTNFIEPIIHSVNMDEEKAKHNLKLLLTLIIDGINGKSNK
jgi:predicted transcriptional regulator